MTQYTDGPADQPWEVDDTGDIIYIQRRGYDARKSDPAFELYVAVDDSRVRAEAMAARLNDLDTARARIALLEARLDALCGAVEAERTVMDTTPDDVRNRLYLAAYEATKAAREVLGG